MAIFAKNKTTFVVNNRKKRKCFELKEYFQKLTSQKNQKKKGKTHCNIECVLWLFFLKNF